MIGSHLQTRTLSDALDRMDALLANRGTRLKEVGERRILASCFAAQPVPDFESWAFSAPEYEQAKLAISKRAPELLGRLHRPRDDRDFTVVGHCSLDLRFKTDSNGAMSVKHTLRDGTRVEGARVTAGKALLYSSGLISLPVSGERVVYLFGLLPIPMTPPLA